MVVLELLALGGISLLGSRMAKRKKDKEKEAAHSGKMEHPAQTVVPIPVEITQTPAQIKRDLRLSGAALVLSTTGLLAGAPLLAIMSMPSLVCVAWPTLRTAVSGLRAGTINDESHKAVRVVFCLTTGLFVVAAIDLALQTAVKRKLLETELAFKDRLAVLLGHPSESVWIMREGVEVEMPLYQVETGTSVVLNTGDIAPLPGVVVTGKGRVRPVLATDSEGEAIQEGDSIPNGYVVTEGSIEVRLEHYPAVIPDIRQEMEHAATGKTNLVKLGVQSGTRSAPWMMGAFVAGLPLLGFNHSAVFLTTRMGMQMNEIGPHTARQAITAGLEHGIFIRDMAALERANTCNTIVFDAALLHQPAAAAIIPNLVTELRNRKWATGVGIPRQFALYAMVDSEAEGRKLLETYALDDYFKEPLEWGRSQLLKNLQQAGRNVCYVGLPGKGDKAMKECALSVAWCHDGLPRQSAATMLLAGAHLPDLASLFDLAKAFATRQTTSFLTPLGVDMLNLTVNIFLNYGLLNSVVISHAASLLDVSGSGFVKREAITRKQDEPTSGEEKPVIR